MDYKTKKGFALIVAIFFIVVFSVIGAIAVSMLSSDSFAAFKDYRSERALEISDAGLKFALATQLLYSADWTTLNGLTKNFAGGSFTVSYNTKQTNHVIVQSSATYSGVTRTTQVTADRSAGGPKDFGYGMYAGNQGGGPLVVQNSATVNGDFYYNGAVTFKNAANLINGTLTSSSVSLQNSGTVASWEPLPVPPVAPPSFESSYYDNILLATNTSTNQALSLTGTQVFNLNGSTQYFTSVTLNNSSQLNGPGTIVATTGNFIAQNSAGIGNSIRIIVKGTSTFSNAVAIGNSVEVISNGSVTINNSGNFPMDNLIFSYGDITFNNAAYFYGSILAPDGTITSSNATLFRGLLYGDTIDLQNGTDLQGSIIVNSIGYFSNNATVTYNPNVLPSNWPHGLTGAGFSSIPTTTLWQEVY